jgi:hypothetical protein
VVRRFDPWAWGTAGGALLFLTIFQSLLPGGFLYDDNTLEFLPSYAFDYDAVRHGQIPELNVYQYLGQSWLSGAQEGAFYPPVYFAMALAHFFHRWQVSIDWLCWVHLAGAAVVVGQFARLWGIRPVFAMATGWLYLTLPFICCSSQLWVLNAYCAFYVPLALLGLEKLIRQASIRGVLALAAVKALFIFSGHVNYFALSLVIEAIYLGFRFYGAKGVVRPGLLWVAANGLAGWAALPSLGPVLTHARTAAHVSIHLRLDQILDLHVMPVEFIIAQFGYWMFWSYAYQPAWMFLGGSVFLPALLLKSRRKRRVLLFLALGLVALALSTPAYILIHYLPGYGSFRWPAKMLLFVALFYALLFAALVRHLPRRLPRWMGGLLFAAAIGCNVMVDFSPHAHAVTWVFRRYPPEFHLPLARLQDGRSVSVADSSDHRYNPDFLNGDYASMIRVPVVGGYDVLIADQNRQEALNMFFGNYEGKLNDSVIGHLRSWSVRHYFVETGSDIDHFLQPRTDFQEAARLGQITIFDDKKAPGFAYFESDPSRALAVTYRPNGIEVETGPGRGGTLSLSLVPLPGYTWQDVGAANPVSHPVPAHPQGRMRIEHLTSDTGRVALVYREPGLPLFLFLGAIAWILGALVAVLAPFPPGSIFLPHRR